jgi:hypothetical protein
MDLAEFIRDLIRSASEDNWEPTDTGYQLTNRKYTVVLRVSGESNIELSVEEAYDGKPIAKTAQKPVPEGADDIITLELAFLHQVLQRTPVDRVSALNDVVRELRIERGKR